MADRTVALILATSTGGVGTHVHSLAAGLVADGWSVRVCGPAATNKLFRFSDVGASFHDVQIGGSPADLAAVRPLQRSISGSAVVHAHGTRAGAIAALARVRPLVVTWHNFPVEPVGPRRVLAAVAERLTARRATVSLAASDDLAVHVRELGGRDVRDGPIATTLGSPQRSAVEVRAELGLGPTQQLALCISRLHSQKGLDVLIAAASRWAAEDVMVCVAGDGPLRARLERQIAETGAPVRLLGRRDDTADLLAAADLVLLASRWEARALAAQEALLAGRALVATAVGGLPKLLGDGALLVPADDVDALDGAVRKLLADPALRASLAARGAAVAARWPTVGQTVAQVSAVYTELIGSK
jgi:glycosyltransferase involved in cell wall biosynthesis